MKRIITIITVAFLPAFILSAEDYLPDIPFNAPSGISTYVFGPNAFPVPDIVKDTEGKLNIELYGSYFSGFLTSQRDHTANIDFKVRVPLWTDRANLCIWGQFESYWDNPMVREARNVDPGQALHDSKMGDIYFSVDMKVLRERKYIPSLVVRAACKSASGGDFPRARYYDSPGYFFDACFAKVFNISNLNGRGNFKIGIAASAGFLCWQVDKSRQNDAIMYGAGVSTKHEWVNLNLDLSGYVGWKKEHDTPMTITLRVDAIPGKMFSPFLIYRHGFVDWPFDQISFGVQCKLNILRNQK